MVCFVCVNGWSGGRRKAKKGGGELFDFKQAHMLTAPTINDLCPVIMDACTDFILHPQECDPSFDAQRAMALYSVFLLLIFNSGTFLLSFLWIYAQKRFCLLLC